MAGNTGNLREYSVSELSSALKGIVEDNFSLVRLRGELGRVVKAASGHMYLDVKDDRAVINGVIWKGVASRLQIKPEQGMEVVATGKMTTFPGQSRYQIVIDSLEPAGVGALMALFEKRKKQLAAEGLFAEERKQEIPYLPRTIGVVTSPSGAVIRDILHRLKERFPSHVLVWPTLVQGKEAEKQIVAAINGFNSLPEEGAVPRPDVLIVARGGGSLEDLWCFNEEAVARAAAASKIPLISAVGHETDTTLIDYVADRRAPTPTAAAEFATPVRGELLSELLNKERRLLDAQSRVVEAAQSGLRAAERGLGRPEDILGPYEQRFDRQSERLSASLRSRLDKATTKLAHAGGRFSPRVLAAGFEMRAGRVERACAQLNLAIKRIAERRTDRLASLTLKPHSIRTMTERGEEKIDQIKHRIELTVREGHLRKVERLTGLEKLLSSLSHHNVLARGFALVRDETGDLIRSTGSVQSGKIGSIELEDGRRSVTFGDKLTHVIAGETPKLSTQKKRKLLPDGSSDNQKSLFD